MGDKDYFLRRAAEELAAAERATCVEAKGVHQELASRYLSMIDHTAAAPAAPSVSAASDRLSA
ncbi:hypothetical protein [Sphingomonas sp.]|uniref:hypothetical protein n=1 Tax=Sphingomonas sp. TaxID=28214 RepID=UPI0017B967A7|nr:hypothetical protein [Sphingomonas sp.]MBA3512736.1 hypothetical protein [Sphingomonas sp.]